MFNTLRNRLRTGRRPDAAPRKQSHPLPRRLNMSNEAVTNQALNLARGRVVQSISGMERGSDHVKVTFTDGASLTLYHNQSCCEDVEIEDITGDPTDLINQTLVMCEVTSNSDNPPEPTPDSHTWTFYKFGTLAGYVTLRWLGVSSGYYSEKVTALFTDLNGAQTKSE